MSEQSGTGSLWGIHMCKSINQCDFCSNISFDRKLVLTRSTQMINQSHSLTVFNFMWFSWGRVHSFWKLAKHLVDHLNHLLSKENIHQQSSTQGKNGDVVLSSVRVWNETQPLHKDEKFCHYWRIESTGSWIPLIELKPDSHKTRTSQRTTPDECCMLIQEGYPPTMTQELKGSC